MGTVQNLGLFESKIGTNFRKIFEMTGTKSVVNLEKLKYLMVLGGGWKMMTGGEMRGIRRSLGGWRMMGL